MSDEEMEEFTALQGRVQALQHELHKYVKECADLNDQVRSLRQSNYDLTSKLRLTSGQRDAYRRSLIAQRRQS